MYRMAASNYKNVWRLIHWYNKNTPPHVYKRLPTRGILTKQNLADFRYIKQLLRQHGGRAGFMQAQRQQADSPSAGMAGVRSDITADTQSYTNLAIARITSRGINFSVISPEARKMLQDWARGVAQRMADDVSKRQFANPQQKEQYVYNTVDATVQQAFPKTTVDQYMATARK